MPSTADSMADGMGANRVDPLVWEADLVVQLAPEWVESGFRHIRAASSLRLNIRAPNHRIVASTAHRTNPRRSTRPTLKYITPIA